MISEKVVEAAAEAIWNEESIRAHGKARSVPWSEVLNEHQDRYRQYARAAFKVHSLHEDRQDDYWRGWNDACDAMCDLSLWKRAFAEMKKPLIADERGKSQ